MPLSAFAQQPPSIPINELKGVVVSKEDGKPLAGVTVAMAHAEDAWLWFGPEGALGAQGPKEKVLFFFTKLNGLTACEAVTDHEGRFTFSSFRSTSQRYTVAACHKTYGACLLTSVVPDEVPDELLRIELDPPAFIEAAPLSADLRDWKKGEYEYYDVSFEPTITAPSTNTSADHRPDRINVFFNLVWWPGAKAPSRLGPLPGGHRYRLAHRRNSNRTGAPATLFEKVLFVKPGETVKALPDLKGATVTGRVSTTKGQPLRDVNVTVALGPQRQLILGAVTDEKGVYTLTGLPPGNHSLQLERYAVRTGPG